MGDRVNARGITVVVSVVVHGAIAIAALTASEAKHKHANTTVSVADVEKKKKEEPPKPPPLPPPPPKAPPKAPPKVAKAPAPTPTPTAPPPPTSAEPPAAPQHIDTGYGNGDGTGPAIKKNEPPHPVEPPHPKPPPPHAAKPPKEIPKPPPPVDESGKCTEPPGKPEPVRKTEIEYTDEARASGVEGYLKLKVTVDASGNVTKVEVVQGVDPQLDAAAIATVKTWHFKPALACGKPVAGGTYIIGRKFELSD